MKKKRRSISPYLTFAGVWLLSMMASNTSGLAGFLVITGVSLLAAVGVGYLVGRKNKKAEEAEAALDVETLVNEALAGLERIAIDYEESL